MLDSVALRRFVGIDLGRERVPDGTTLLKFRRRLEKHEFGAALFAEGERDPQMHQTRKGQQWYFGMKLRIGVDSTTGLAHSAVVTAANVHDKHPLPQLLCGAEQEVYGDSAYASQQELIESKAPLAEDRTNQRVLGSGIVAELELERIVNRIKSKVRSRVVLVFAVVKRQFGFAKVRYRGLKKNATRAFVVLGLANIYLARGRLAG